MAFDVEVIPDNAALFRKIHHTHLLPDGTVTSAAFKQERMSVNWERYKSAENSADKNSAAVVALAAGKCKELGQTVEHTPIEPDQPFGPNQAHAEVCGKKTSVISQKLRDIAKMAWLRPSAGV